MVTHRINEGQTTNSILISAILVDLGQPFREVVNPTGRTDIFEIALCFNIAYGDNINTILNRLSHSRASECLRVMTLRQPSKI